MTFHMLLKSGAVIIKTKNHIKKNPFLIWLSSPFETISETF